MAIGEMISLILQVVIFPGLLFTAAVGLVTSWIDRKVTARVQMRQGPPFLQPFYDIVKYMIKETCVPAGGSRFLFLSAPLLGLAGVSLASMIIWRALLFPSGGVVGDLVVALYLLTMPAVAVVIGSFASRNPLASLGGSREMKLLLSYELPLVLAVGVSVIKTHQDPEFSARCLQLGSLAATSSIWSLSGLIALVVGILCMQAKLTLVPFDAPEAETELAGGAYIEYSGPPLGIYKLTRSMMLFTMPMLLVTVFCGGLGNWIVPGVIKYVLLVVVVVLIRNTAPRVRIDQAMRFFWGPVTAAALVAVALAFLGW